MARTCVVVIATICAPLFGCSSGGPATAAQGTTEPTEQDPESADSHSRTSAPSSATSLLPTTPQSAATPPTAPPGTVEQQDSTVAKDAYPLAHVRRLSNRELGNSLRSLLGTFNVYETTLPADTRQSNFTRNEGQVVSSDWGMELQRIANRAAKDVLPELTSLSPCADEETITCAREFISALATQAFRREPEAVELEELFAVFATGNEAGFARGMELVISALVQSPSFVYVTHLGAPPLENSGSGVLDAEQATLSSWEIAAALAYVTTESPPDEELLMAARNGTLAQASERATQARRLLSTSAGINALSNMIVEWFTAEGVSTSFKDNIPEFNERRDALLQESRDFTSRVVESHDADFVTLLTADFTLVSQPVARYYGLDGSGELDLSATPRLGAFTQAAFLATHASPTESRPIRRGAAFLRQVLCTEPGSPSALGIAVVPPEPDPALSTRQLFAAHTEDELCQGCHAVIDPIGFAFEQFDEGGRVRSGTADNNGHPVDASGSLTVGGETFVFSDAAEFLRQVARSDVAQRCVAKMASRYAFGSRWPTTESAFVALWEQLDPAQRTQLDEVLIKLIESELFIVRRVQ